MTQQEFSALRQRVIEKDFNRMNKMQFAAVTTASGPLLVLAGAGSGKTTVLVNRIAYLVKYGNAYNSTDSCNFSENDIAAAQDFLSGNGAVPESDAFSAEPARPWEILAITFTNKAAGELKERIARRLGDSANDIWAGTFHSVCGKMLRRFADRLGYTSHFTIYDTDDQKKLMKEIMKDNRVDEKLLPVKFVLSQISSAKDKLITPDVLARNCGDDMRIKTVAELYRRYSDRLLAGNAMDFDDMIVNTVRLLEENPDILEYYGGKFRYIMVDEYQDTNHAQYMLVKKLASVHNNICVVGDDDQSIYKFRGATIENILSFENQYKNACVIRLEQNYRSTTTILDAANAVIAHNAGRKGKTLWTDNGIGEKITVNSAENERDEARNVADAILDTVRDGGKFRDNVILYRMNAQSNAVENVFMRSGIPYRVIGGLKFYDRKEIKDIMAYLNIINNPADDIRLKRIINEPRRGIGETTVANASQIAAQTGIPLYDIFKTADEYAVLSRSTNKLQGFTALIDELREYAADATLHDLLEAVIDKTGYRTALELAGPEEQDRIDNLRELSSSVFQYELENDEPTLSGFLEDVALITDMDNYDTDSDAVVMMTIHCAKGLEFDNVYIIGMEEGIFPGNQSIYGGEAEIEEERRLAYVALTRAKKRLTISTAYTRMLYGMTGRNLPSRFLKEIPEELCSFTGQTFAAQRSYYSDTAETGFESEYGNKSRVSAYGSSYSAQSAAPRYAAASSFSSYTAAKPSSVNTQSYSSGQRIEHNTFGAGTVVKATPMAQDTMLEIKFDSGITKKIMAGFARLKNI